MQHNLLLQQQGRVAPIKAPATKPAPIVGVPWTSQILITAGFSTPEQWPIARPRPINSVVWHDMEGYLPAAIATWNQGNAGAHLCILMDGRVVLTCKLENIAWHAGTDANNGRTQFWKTHNINPYSVGIELEGFYDKGYTAYQIAACVQVARYLTQQYGIVKEHTFDHIPGHHTHSELSNQRLDPGPYFPLDKILGAI